jgi:hypothetical protein
MAVVRPQFECSGSYSYVSQAQSLVVVVYLINNKGFYTLITSKKSVRDSGVHSQTLSSLSKSLREVNG